MKTLAEYPTDSWRPNQRAYAEQVLALASNGEPARCALEGPCGSGKSVGYLRPLLDPSAPKSMVLTTTRQHLRQLEETLRRDWPGGEGEEWAILRGRSYYSCCGQKPKGDKKNPITAEDYDPAQEHTEPEEQSTLCPLGEDKCQYRQAVRAAARAQVNFQATIGALYRKRFWGELSADVDPTATNPEKAAKRAAWAGARRAVVNREVVVLDEAHEYLRVRRDFETQKVDLWLKGILDPKVVAALQAARQKFGNYVASYVLLEPKSSMRGMLIANFQTLLLDQNVEKMLPAGKHLDNRDEIKRRWIEKLNTRLSMLETGDVVSVQWEGWGMTEKCSLVSEPLYAGVRDKLAPVEIFTSATIAEIAPLMGIAKSDVTIYPEIFNWDSSVQPNPLPDNAAGSKKNVALDAEMLEEIYRADGRPLTVALFLSKKQAHEAAKRIARKPGVFVQGLDPDTDLGELVEDVKRSEFAANDQGGTHPMLICYGGWVGTDIPGNKWLIIGSAPKTPISPVHEARQARRKIRSAWDDGEKVTLDRLQLQQGLGRALRTAEDRCQIMWPANQAFADLGLSEATARLL